MTTAALHWETVLVALIAAVAALAGAGIAAWTARSRLATQLDEEGKRQTKQLAEERDRHREVLAAEAKRQGASLEAEGQRHRETLANERTIADRVELRALLDEAAGALGAAGLTLLSAQGAMEVDEASRKLSAEALIKSRNTLDGYLQRIALRVGSSDAIYTHYNAAQRAITFACQPFARRHMEKAERNAKLTEHAAAFSTAHGEFLKSAELVVGSKVPGVTLGDDEFLRELGVNTEGQQVPRTSG